MKLLKCVLPVLVLAMLAYGQDQKPATEDLGLGAFASERGPILIAVDAALVDLQLNNPYVMFVLYVASKNQNQDIVVDRNTIVMIYKGQEYKMPSIKELRENYRGTIRDIDFYRHLGKEGIVSSWIRFFNFPAQPDFFPPLTLRGGVPVDQGSLYGFTGFRTKAYFKNPGFKKGDTLTFKVWDKKDPKITGQVDVVLD